MQRLAGTLGSLVLLLWCQFLAAQPLITHPEPERPLAVKWQWALEQAGTGATASRWLAYQFSTTLDEKIRPQLHAQRAASADNWRRDEVGQWQRLSRGAFHDANPQRLSTAALLAGNTRRQQPLLQQHDLVLLARFAGEALAELRVTGVHDAVDWQGVPVYWLGAVTSGESFRALGNLLDPAQDHLLNSALLRALGLHADPDRAGFLFSLYNTPQWVDLRPVIIDSLALQPSADVEQLLLEVAADQNAPLPERRVAIAALHQFDSAAAQELLLTLAAALNPRVIREVALQALTLFDSAAVLDAISGIANTDQDRDIVESAIDSIALLHTHAAHTVLLEIAREHPQPFARETALRNLQRALL